MKDILILIPLVGVAYLGFAALCLHRFARRERRATAAQPPITVLKPLCGLEPDLAANLA